MTFKERYASDPEFRAKNLASSKAWRSRNKSQIAARKKRTYDATKVAERNRKWREANNDSHKANARKWHADNRERSTENKRKWHAANREKHRGYQHVRRERLKGVEQCDRKSLNVLQQLIASTPRLKCGLCGKAMRKDDRTVDHIIPIVRGGTGNIGNLRVVHRSCNSRKSAHLPHEVTGQYEITFVGNGTQPNTIRENCALSVHNRDETPAYSILDANSHSLINSNN